MTWHSYETRVTEAGKAASLHGFSELTRLGHSDARVAELEGQIADVLGSIAQLDEVDVTGVEPAVIYNRPLRDDHAT
jgi:Asp-tRNA(Asn)/Glu-tRNA(Gln) amidotransferase C subunit